MNYDRFEWLYVKHSMLKIDKITNDTFFTQERI